MLVEINKKGIIFHTNTNDMIIYVISITLLF